MKRRAAITSAVLNFTTQRGVGNVLGYCFPVIIFMTWTFFSILVWSDAAI